MQTRSRKLTGALAAAAALTAAAFSLGTAQAQDGTQTSAVTGTVKVKTNTFELPDGSSFTGTVDSDAGTIEGTISIPELVYKVTDPLTTDVHIKLTIPDGVNGTVNAEGNVAVTAAARIEITSVDVLGPTPGCVFAPVDLDLTGTYDEASGQVTLADEEFTIPPAPGTCAIAALANPMLAGEGNSIDLAIALGEAPAETTTTTAPATTTTAVTATTAPGGTTTPPATGATPQSARPSYTG